MCGSLELGVAFLHLFRDQSISNLGDPGRASSKILDGRLLTCSFLFVYDLISRKARKTKTTVVISLSSAVAGGRRR